MTARYANAGQTAIIWTDHKGTEWHVPSLDSDTQIGRELRAWVDAGNTIAAFAAPAPTANDVRAEAQRRIIALVGATDIIHCLIRQHNAQMRATELTLIKATGGTWTTEQAAEAAALQAMADQIKAIRAASNVLEENPPADYTANRHWP